MLLDTGQPDSVVFRQPRSKLWVELQQISWRNARHHIEIIEPLVRRDQSHIQSAGCLEGEGCDRPNITLPKGQEKLRSLGNCWHIAIKIAGKWLFIPISPSLIISGWLFPFGSLIWVGKMKVCWICVGSLGISQDVFNRQELSWMNVGRN